MVMCLDTTRQSSKTVSRRWLCRCDCGSIRSIAQGKLTTHDGQQSCGCLQSLLALDLTGRRFGRLVVLGLARHEGQQRRYWICRCDCAMTTIVRHSHLTTGKIISCGCWRREQTITRNTTHGHSRRHQWSHEYIAYASMKQRCLDHHQQAYRDYGGRGISVCAEWINSFAQFLNDIGPRPPGMSLDRINVNGHYEPRNVRWTDRKTQARNKRNTRILLVDGVAMSLAEAVERFAVNRTSIMRAVRGSILHKKNREKLAGHSIIIGAQATELLPNMDSKS